MLVCRSALMTVSREGLPRRLFALPVVSIEQLWPVAVLAGVFIMLRSLPIRPQDFWWHISIGREIVSTGRIPTVDTFSYTAAGQPYNYTSFWLMEVLLYLLYHWGGAALVLFFHRILIMATYALVLLISYRASGSLRAAAVATVAATLVGMGNWNVRPQVMAFPLSAIMLWAIYAYRWRPRTYLLAIFLAVMVIWANSHGSFVVGYVFLGIWLVDETWSALKGILTGQSMRSLNGAIPPVIALALSGAAAMLNPRGPALFRYVLDLAGNPLIRDNVMEWAPPSFATFYGTAFLAALLASAALLAVSPRRPTLFQMLTFLALGGLSLKTARFELWFGMAMAPVIAEHLDLTVRHAGQRLAEMTGQPVAMENDLPTSNRHRSKRRVLNNVLAAIIVVYALLGLPWWQEQLHLPGPNADLISPETPVAATDFLLHQRPPGPIFNEQGYGSYLIWAAQPSYPVFVDTRLELYPWQTWVDYLTISQAGTNWDGLLDKYGINTLFIGRVEQPDLVKAASNSSRWRQLYQDSRSLIFVRAGNG
jgi:hypothetical protein